METNNLSLVSEVTLTYKSKIKNSERQKICDSKDCCNIFKSIVDYNDKINLYECFYAMYLNRSNKVLSVMLISEGGTTGTVVDMKKIIAPAILQNACAIVISHNHPSGNLQPSEADITITRRLKESLNIMDIQLLDHIIITDESHFSFADENII